MAFNISGGLHHAAAGQASGFCVFNDPAVAINYLPREGAKGRLRGHRRPPRGRRAGGVYDNDQALTVSVHESGRYLFPGTGFVSESGSGPGIGYSVNVPLYPYTDDETYMEVFRAAVLPILKAFGPDVLVSSWG